MNILKKDDQDQNETTLSSLLLVSSYNNEQMVPNPTEMAQKEIIFLLSKYMALQAIAFTSLGRAFVRADIEHSKRGLKGFQVDTLRNF